MKAFEAVGRTGSVRSAGDEIGVSHTVVSRHLRHLQESLGVALFQPEGRGIILTPAGRIYHAEIVKAFSLLRAATTEIRGSSSRHLEVWCMPGIISRRLLPQLPQLNKHSMRLAINLRPTLALPRLETGEADASIMYSDRPELDGLLRAESLARPRVFPVASPAFLARHTKIDTLEKLVVAPLLHEETTAYWTAWLIEAGIGRVPLLGGQRLWHSHVAIEAARLGQGIALANELLVEEEISSGSLVEVISSETRMSSYQIVSLASRWEEPSLRALRSWLHDALAIRKSGA
nr:LysR substrate-binding domain-containing protein [Aureimonas sp. SA4125]